LCPFSINPKLKHAREGIPPGKERCKVGQPPEAESREAEIGEAKGCAEGACKKGTYIKIAAGNCAQRKKLCSRRHIHFVDGEEIRTKLKFRTSRGRGYEEQGRGATK